MKLIPATSAPYGKLEDWLMPESEPLARIALSAWVTDSACVGGDGEVKKTEDYITLGPLGSRKEFLTLHRDTKLGVRIVTGCWSGSLGEFLARLTDSKEHTAYREIVPAAERILRERMTPLEL